MPPYAVEPGSRLVDRYRLEEHLGEAGGTSYWRAQDELLDRPVGVCLLGHGTDGASRILGAARRAAAINDPRFLRVLDASDNDGMVYVVTEWVRASNLADLLADGPLPPAEARAMAIEIADALAAAHRQGLSHLCLQPEHVLRTGHGQVKVSGLAVDAAVRGLEAEGPADAALQDARGCAAVLYAALTARWPNGQHSSLPAAPRDDGQLCSPRQVRAGIPDDLDEATCRGLGARTRHPVAPLDTPADLAEQLAATHATTRIPVISQQTTADDERSEPAYRPSYLAPYDDEGGRGRGAAAKAAWALAAMVLVVGLGLAGWQLLMAALDNTDGPKSNPRQSATEGPATGTEPVKVAAVEGFDPEGDGEENSDRADRVIDGETGTVWTTKTYFDPFGPSGIKDGVGLLLDLGEKKSVRSVAVALQGGDTDLEIRVADDRGEQADDYRLVAEASDADGLTQLRPDEAVTARYVLVWLTAIPPADGSNYRGTVAEVAVRG